MTRAVVMAGWDSVPHLSEAEKARLLESIPPAFREARMKGIPTIGEGAIYPLRLDDIVVDDFPVPRHWPRGYGMDVGWKATAGVCGAWDRDPGKDIVYLYREYKRGQAEPPVHTAAIKGFGANLWGAIDPAARGRNQKDGSRLMTDYQALGLQLIPAANAVEAGLLACYERFTTGRLKIFRSLTATQAELKLYRREDGKVVKENDHLMDCMRYLVMTLEALASLWTPEGAPETVSEGGSKSWMGR